MGGRLSTIITAGPGRLRKTVSYTRGPGKSFTICFTNSENYQKKNRSPIESAAGVCGSKEMERMIKEGEGVCIASVVQNDENEIAQSYTKEGLIENLKLRDKILKNIYDIAVRDRRWTNERVPYVELQIDKIILADIEPILMGEP
jgi:hypothetical protein